MTRFLGKPVQVQFSVMLMHIYFISDNLKEVRLNLNWYAMILFVQKDLFIKDDTSFLICLNFQVKVADKIVRRE